MKELWDDEGMKLEGELDKVKALIRRNFITYWEEDNNNGQEGEGDKKVDRELKEWKEYKTEVREALSIIKNTSATGPDGMNYKAIKTILNTPLREGLIDEIADSLYSGYIPTA